MPDPAARKIICIHGHFYQPPRENPWLDAIEAEESARPYHDWNERIHDECYRANAAARLVDDRNRILDLRNNYASLSFNIGPTLFRWIETRDPWVYRAIIDADRTSAEQNGGHGNAIAQAYNHIILPLATRRDKVTQVRWGIRDFEFRFGRKPEGMWLPEAAVDGETLDVLAEEGIRFTILSPYQAARWRFLKGGSREWQDVRGGAIPTGRAYRYTCPSGRTIHLFFYDGGIAKGVAFERLLEHSSRLIGRIDQAFRDRESRDEPWLIHAATDGESYGHHFKFGDMALAAAFRELEKDPLADVTNYGAFLDAHPVLAEVEVLEKTAWSCAHGLGRWQEDCGCHIGGGPDWKQKWRRPLRDAMNGLSKAAAAHFEREMGRLVRDPWAVRNDYIDVVLAPGSKESDDFAERHLPGSAPEARLRFRQLLEMQRHAMAMFTSCGWFFDEISGIESGIILKHAARVIQLAGRTGATDLEKPFVETLDRAPSNDPEFGTGAGVYRKKVRPAVVELEQVAANYAIQAMARSTQRQPRLYTYKTMPGTEADLGPGAVPTLCGVVDVTDRRTGEGGDYLYAVVHFGALDFRCGIRPCRSDGQYTALLAALRKAVEEQNTAATVRILDETFGGRTYTLEDVFKDLRSQIAFDIAAQNLSVYTALQRHLYHANRPLMASMRQWNVQVPVDLRSAVRRVLSDDVERLVEEILDHEQDETEESGPSREEADFFHRAHVARLTALKNDAASWGIALRLNTTSAHIGDTLIESMGDLIQTFSAETAGKVMRLLGLCRLLDIRPALWKLQTRYFELMRRIRKSPEKALAMGDVEAFAQDLDDALDCRFALLLKDLPISFARAVAPVRKPPLPVPSGGGC